MSKKLGQNFLLDDEVKNSIIEAINPLADEHLVEIGPGRGALTFHLLPLVKKLDVIEVDSKLAIVLKNNVNYSSKLRVYNSDVLEFDFNQLQRDKSGKQPSLKLFGNLPYSISTPLLFHLLKYHDLFFAIFFMMQKEVAMRIAAKVNSTIYSRLTVMVQYYYHPTYLFTVSPEAFSPAPKVDSGFISLIPRSREELRVIDNTVFAEIVKKAFGQRRKKIINSLKLIFGRQDFKDMAIDPNCRAQELTVNDFISLSNYQSEGRSSCGKSV